MEKLDLRDLVTDIVESQKLDETVIDKAIQYIKDNEVWMETLELIVVEAISSCV